MHIDMNCLFTQKLATHGPQVFYLNVFRVKSIKAFNGADITCPYAMLIE